MEWGVCSGIVQNSKIQYIRPRASHSSNLIKKKLFQSKVNLANDKILNFFKQVTIFRWQFIAQIPTLC